MANIPTEQQLKISGTGWLCVFDSGEWIAVFKLTDEQVEQWRTMRPRDNG